jgi:hypothetical protein
MSSTVHTNRDGTSVYYDGVHDGIRQISPAGFNESFRTQEYIDDFTAIQIGLFRILAKLTFVTLDRKKLVETGIVESNTMQIKRVFLDFPDTEDEFAPLPSITIMAPAETALELSGPLSGQQLLEDTLGLYGEGLVLRKVGEVEATIEVVSILTHTDERAGLRRGLIDAFTAEPDDERSGRRVIVSEYFDRIVRYDLMGITYGDTAETAQQKNFPLVARFMASTELVKLVAAPTALLEPRISVTTDL